MYDASGNYYKAIHDFADAGCARRPLHELKDLAEAVGRSAEPYQNTLEALLRHLDLMKSTAWTNDESKLMLKLLALLLREQRIWADFPPPPYRFPCLISSAM